MLIVLSKFSIAKHSSLFAFVSRPIVQRVSCPQSIQLSRFASTSSSPLSPTMSDAAAKEGVNLQKDPYFPFHSLTYI
jgi:hypothetical protein